MDMKKTTINFITVTMLAFLLVNCRSKSNEIDNRWHKERIGGFTLKLPSRFQLNYSPTNSSQGVIINGHDSIKFTIAFLAPDIFINSGKVLRIVKKKSIKGELIYGRKVGIVCLYDTTRSTSMFSGSKRYSSLVLIQKNITENQLDTLKMIFNTIYRSQ